MRHPHSSHRLARRCESCGFTGIPAGHRIEGTQIEPWEQVVARFDGASLPPAQTERTESSGTVPTGEESDAAIDPHRLEETVSVEVTLRDGPDEESDEE